MKFGLAVWASVVMTALPQASAACSQLSESVWMCDRGTAWENATWDPVGDGTTRYLGEVILNFTDQWPGFEISDSSTTLSEQFDTYTASIADENTTPPEVLQVDKIVTPRGLTLRHLQYDEIDGSRTMSAVMLSEVGSSRIMVYLDSADTMPLEEMEKISFEVAMMLRDSCADEITCADAIAPTTQANE